MREQNAGQISPVTELDWRQPTRQCCIRAAAPERMMECLNLFEHFIHDEKHKLPILVEAGLIHAQFQTIHPFLDGNGRLGRLLITLLLCAKGIMREPLPYLSLYFKIHRQRYYDLLPRAGTEGVWEEWIEFFLEGTATTARHAVDTAVQILHLFEVDRKKFERWAAKQRQAWPFINTCKHIR